MTRTKKIQKEKTKIALGGGGRTNDLIFDGLGGGERKNYLFFDGLGGGGQKNNSAKIDWVDLDKKNNFSVAAFFRQGGQIKSRAVFLIIN